MTTITRAVMTSGGKQFWWLVRAALVLALVPTVSPANAQQVTSRLEAVLMEGRLESIDSLGVRQFAEQVTDSRRDSAEVYYNVHGDPVAWRAWIDGQYHVYWQPYGRFRVSDSTLAALEVFKRERPLLEMLEALELVEQAAKAAP